MGKVITEFDLGYAGSISRSVDDIVIQLINDSQVDIPFGAPVFMTSGGGGVEPFACTDDSGTPQAFTAFVGFAVRSGAKTPNEYPNSQAWSSIDSSTEDGQTGVYKPQQPVDILVRGAIMVKSAQGFDVGGKVYIRKSDGRIVKNAGTEGSTVLLENVRCRTPQVMGGNCNEMVVLSRNIL